MEPDKTYNEWYFQADYDLEVAEDMFKSGRYIYCIFMCHLSLEKGLKGLFNKRSGEYPPKSYSLIYFVEKALYPFFCLSDVGSNSLTSETNRWIVSPTGKLQIAGSYRN